MSMLEEKIRKNRDVLDGAEPPEGHLDRFQAKLAGLHEGVPTLRRGNSGRLFRVAAVIAVLMAFSVTYYLVDPSYTSSQLAANTLPQEIQDARMYYDKLAETKIQKISELAKNPSEASYIQKVVDNEISSLDSSSVQLETELQNDKQNERLINALLRNYKTKSDLLDNVLSRLRHI